MTWSDPREIADGRELPPYLVATQEILLARVGISRYGFEGWRGLYQVEPTECLGPALEILEAELDRLERTSRTAARERKEAPRPASRRRHGEPR